MDDYRKGLEQEKRNLAALLDPKNLNALLNTDDLDGTIDMADDDDEELLKELGEFHQDDEDGLDEATLQAEIDAEEAAALVGGANDNPGPTLEELKEQLQKAKLDAVNLKRAGNKQEALAKMNEISDLKSKIAAAESHSFVSSVEVAAADRQASAVIADAVKTRLETVAAIQDDVQRRDKEQVAEMLQTRLQQYTATAVKLSRAGNKTQAAALLPTIKEIKGLIADLEEGQEVTFDIIPEAPEELEEEEPSSDTVVMHAPVVPVVVPRTPTLTLSSAAQKQYTEVEEALETRIQYFDKRVRELYAGGQASKEDKILAVEFNRIKKLMIASREELHQAKERCLPPPVLVHEATTFTREIRNDGIGPNELEMTIVECVALTHSSLKGNEMMPYVSWSVEAAGEEQKGQTTVAQKTANPVFNHTVKVKIDRKGAAKKWKFTKINMEVWHHRTLWKHTLLGSGVFKPVDLMEKSELTLDTKLKLENKSAGSLKVTFRLLCPLNGRDVRTVEEKYLSLDFPAATRVIPTVSTANRTAAIAAAPASAPVARPAVAAQPVPGGANLAAGVTDPHDVAKMCSNEVLEAELALCSAALKADSKNEDLQERKTAIEVKIQVLVALVQNEKLSMDAYLAQVKASIVSEKALATALVKAGKQEDALRVLRRVKIMEAEVAEAEAS